MTVNLGVVGITNQRKSSSTESAQQIRAETAFRDAIPSLENFNLVFFVDEAQNIPVSKSAKSVVSCLHHGIKGLSLIAAFFGLSDTKQILSLCGLSRLPRERVVDLDTLSHEDARSAIQSVFDVYDFNVRDWDVWVNELAKLSQGWPQHINSVTVSAGEIIHENGSCIQPDLLSQALHLGRERKKQYYISRLETCPGRAWVFKKLALAAGEKNGLLGWNEINDLTKVFRSEKGQSIDEFMTDALHAGVLMDSKSLPDYYKFPIPSFGDYLRALPH
ncbi:MAG: hypothetical protein OXD01_07980 [Gammaproteobacteria bacterium]|nr:hypothetical protein [Gammaproteobacteria bacterium]